MNDASTQTIDPNAPALGLYHGVSFGTQTHPHEMRAQVHVPYDWSEAKINALLDKLAHVLDRQAAIYELRQLEIDAQAQESTGRELESQLLGQEEISKARWNDSGRRGEWDPGKMSAQEKQAYEQAKQSVTRYREGADRARFRIAQLRKVMNGHDDRSQHSGAG